MKNTNVVSIAIIGVISLIGTSPTHVKAAEKPIGILLAGGDISSCKNNYEWKQYANKTGAIIRDEISKASAAEPPIPVRVLALGDLAYRKGTESEFKCYSERWRGFDDVLRPVPGNHEYLSPGAGPYFDHFSANTFVHQQANDKPYIKGYFTEKFPNEKGPWLLIGLNSHLRSLESPFGKAVAEEAISDQRNWLRTQLGAHNSIPCVISFWHAPTFSSGQHGHVPYRPTSSKLPLDSGRPMQGELRILYEHGATAIFAGHDHNYEQFRRHDADGNKADDGLRSFVVGTAGSLLTNDFYEKIWDISDGGPFGKGKLGNGGQGLLKISLFENRYEWRYLSIGGAERLPQEMRKLTNGDRCNTRRSP